MRRAVGLALVIGCTTSQPFPATKFVNSPPATKVDDRLNVPVKPATRDALPDFDAFDAAVLRSATRPMELERHRRALGVNADDEVPDSTWFTNRRGLSVEQMRTGPVTMDNPELHLPWTIDETKPGGTSIGYVVKDTRGIKYLVKFDLLGAPELETGTDVVVDRLLWAAGYNVPENQISYIRESDLVLSSESKVSDVLGNPVRKLKRKKLERELAKVQHERDGRVRVMASRWLDGKPLGDPGAEGVRRDDPNDRIPHELRRDLRGAYTIYAWLDMVDVTTGNMLDMWVADPADPSRHYVMHYSLDFGMSLGVMGSVGYDLRRGHTYRFDWGEATRTMVTLGFYDRSWEHRPRYEAPRGVATLIEPAFDPSQWHPDLPYVPFIVSDRYDQYWGAKIVGQFSRAQIHAAVEAARFSEPESTEYLTNILVARQHSITKYWFAQVAPIDHVEIDPTEGLCFDDLGIEAGVANAAGTNYSIAATDSHGRGIGAPVMTAAPANGHACVVLPNLSYQPGEAYTIFAISIARPNTRGTTYAHVALDPKTRQPRVIGIWRD